LSSPEESPQANTGLAAKIINAIKNSVSIFIFLTFQIIGSTISKFISSEYAGSDAFVWKKETFLCRQNRAVL
jgi:hypothetical protein